jgi:hypothetical protein
LRSPFHILLLVCIYVTLLVVLDTEIVNLIVQIVIGSVTGAVTLTVFLMRWRYGVRRRQESRGAIRDQITHYIRCIEGLREEYQFRSNESPNEEDRAFFRRIGTELENVSARYRRLLQDMTELTMRRTGEE